MKTMHRRRQRKQNPDDLFNTMMLILVILIIIVMCIYEKPTQGYYAPTETIQEDGSHYEWIEIKEGIE